MPRPGYLSLPIKPRQPQLDLLCRRTGIDLSAHGAYTRAIDFALAYTMAGLTGDEPMYPINHIRYEYDTDTDALFGPDADLRAYDIPASCAEYARLVAIALEEAYPDASAIVEPGTGALSIDSDTDHDQIPNGRQIIHDVWESYDWLCLL